MTPENINGTAPKPWYKEPWPWLLMAGPFVVVVAGIVTAWLAISTADGLVADDYYKRGLAAGKTIARSERAQALSVYAALRLTPEGIAVRLKGKEGEFTLPASVSVTLSHPTRAGMDQTVELPREGEMFSAPFRLPSAGHWLVLVEDDAKSWRLMGNVILPASGDVVIGTDQPADIRNQ